MVKILTVNEKRLWEDMNFSGAKDGRKKALGPQKSENTLISRYVRKNLAAVYFTRS